MVPHVEPHWFHLILHSIRYKLGKWFHILEPISIFWGKWFHIHKWNHYGSTWFPIVFCMFGDNGSTFFSKLGKWFHIGRSTVVPQHLSNFLLYCTTYFRQTWLQCLIRRLCYAGHPYQLLNILVPCWGVFWNNHLLFTLSEISAETELIWNMINKIRCTLYLSG